MSAHLLQGGRRTSTLFMHDAWRPNMLYHIIGKAIPGEVLFREEADYRRFLRKNLRDQFTLIFQVYTYCLLTNHYHLKVRTRGAAEIHARLLEVLARRKKLPRYQHDFLDGLIDWHTFVKVVFRSLSSSYAQYYNKKYGRSGQLFIKPTLHGLSDKGEPGKVYSRTLAAYISLNFFKHGLAAANANYPWSALTAPKYHLIEPDVDLHYGSEKSYREFHVQYLQRYGARMLSFDEKRFFANLTPREYFEDVKEWRDVRGRPSLG